ncbi:V-set and immunoglobulin domain-containing protein 10-like [Solea senegalensis]|uniref:V-set and immunoglobulin domain-containing protein 10-like isoform X2 n=1 Tax=Solea senegalensis TaxID=28829 RepID=UPI001C4242F0|nr:V-set and immunoglobulin domain-containing protein 10-like isoform X2 [Solea senegalensis]KAG7476098.1 V-set and immunoglobulin domain-containing protein 10-like [Solea senegalensis]
MLRLDGSWRWSSVLVLIFLHFSLQGAHCSLNISPVGSSRVIGRAGSNVTLAVTFSGATDPVVTWFRGSLPVLTWTVGSSETADVAADYRGVLTIQDDGSLTFVNVAVDHGGNYSVELTKSGLAKAVALFTLAVFEIFQNVDLKVQPDLIKEGSDRFTLQYSMSQGVVQDHVWFFKGSALETTSHYTVEQRSVVIHQPNRSDTGRYTLLLTNPFSRVETHINVTVLYGPDEPTLEARPPQPFYVSGDSLSLVCSAGGFPRPTAQWIFGDQTLPTSHDGVLNRTNVQISQGGVYTCTLVNDETGAKRQKTLTLNVYEKPSANMTCSVQSVNDNTQLQYHCQWPGGAPQAELSFPALGVSISGVDDFSLTVSSSEDLDGRVVTCMAVHPLQNNQCNITAMSPVQFLPALRTTVDSEGRIVVLVQCVSDARPEALVSWSRGSDDVANGTNYQISNSTTWLQIRGYNVSDFVQEKYTCTCRNPLGSQSREIQLQGPAVSDFSLFSNPEGTIVTLTWEVPPTSVVTGFDVQMKGPDLLSPSSVQTQRAPVQYRTIQQRPGSARKTDVSVLDPKRTYRFRVVPRARTTEGEPSEVQRIGPGEGLSGPAIAGIAAGIPCSLLFLFLLAGLVYLCIYFYNNRNRQARYPVSRAVEKTVAVQSEVTPHHLLSGGLKSPPDYNRLRQNPSERSVALPTFVPPPPVRVATTV